MGTDRHCGETDDHLPCDVVLSIDPLSWNPKVNLGWGNSCVDLEIQYGLMKTEKVEPVEESDWGGGLEYWYVKLIILAMPMGTFAV